MAKTKDEYIKYLEDLILNPPTLPKVKMTKYEYIKYLRTQAYWLIVFADEIEHGENDSEWAIDFELQCPDCIVESVEEGLKHTA